MTEGTARVTAGEATVTAGLIGLRDPMRGSTAVGVAISSPKTSPWPCIAPINAFGLANLMASKHDGLSPTYD
jgi:hypothetical protein